MEGVGVLPEAEGNDYESHMGSKVFDLTQNAIGSHKRCISKRKEDGQI